MNHTGIHGTTAVIKRGMDLAGATLGLVLTAPLMAIVAVLVKLDSPGPILFVQERVGKDGEPFRIVKFRTMVANAEARLPELIDVETLDPPVYKLHPDPRLTRLGRWLRRFSLDELPQFWNVLRGEMSLVGPRPEEGWLVARYSPHARQRLGVKPGMTGPMQVLGRGDLSFEERVRIETEYVEHHSLWTDLKILLQTLPAVLRGNGAY